MSKFFPAIIEDYTDGYIYDDETGEVFNEVDKSLIVTKMVINMLKQATTIV